MEHQERTIQLLTFPLQVFSGIQTATTKKRRKKHFTIFDQSVLQPSIESHPH